MTDEEKIEKIRLALQYIKIARKLDQVAHKAMISSDEFEQSVIKPLEEITAWGSDDENTAEKFAKEFQERISQKKTFEKKRAYFEKMLKVFRSPRVFQKIKNYLHRKK